MRRVRPRSTDAMMSGHMTIGAKPPAEVTIDRSLVVALLKEQHTDLADLPLTQIGEGWDNKLFRLGDDLMVRVPRRAASAALIEQEQRWLPGLSLRLPLPVPVPLRVGRPGCGFPWSWSVVPWFPGQSALLTSREKLATTAVALARFLHALHQPAPGDAPRNPWRGVPLASRAATLEKDLRQVEDSVDRRAVLDLWERVLSTPPWSGPPLWIHGDLHPGNLVVNDGRLSAVIDFGDLTAGDPATDLSVGWMLLPSPAARSTFREAFSECDSLDDDTWMRARGWALALGLAYLGASRGDEAMGVLGRTTIDAAVNDNSS
jgi:aminoglycoside phosphotransferase (APT) family kinase protein